MAGGKTDLSNVAKYTSLPVTMRFDPICAIRQPAGFFQVGGTIFYSNGVNAFCRIPTWPKFLEMGGDGAHGAQRAAVPAGMRSDPVCP